MDVRRVVVKRVANHAKSHLPEVTYANLREREVAWIKQDGGSLKFLFLQRAAEVGRHQVFLAVEVLERLCGWHSNSVLILDPGLSDPAIDVVIIRDRRVVAHG